jgi:non-heme chloroperoxidase
MTSIEVNNAKLNVVEQGIGQSVVFVHGSVSDWRTWTPQMEPFSAHYRTITYSRRYHWPNEAIPDGVDYQMSSHVDDLVALLRALNLAPAHLVGNSYGAFICLRLALREPELVRSLVLGEPPVLPLFISIPSKPQELIRLFLKRPRTAVTIIRFAATGLGPATQAFQRADLEGGMRTFASAALGRDSYERLPEARRQQMRDNVKTLQAELLGSGFKPFSEAEARQIQLPTLLVTGEDSPALFHRLTDKLTELLPNNEQITIPHASHMMHEQNAPEYNKAVLAFLARHST